MPPESDGKGCFVVCTELHKVVPSANHIKTIQDAVHRVHRIVLDATELMALHLSRCLESGIVLPHVDANWIKMAHDGGEQKRWQTETGAPRR